jgi:hypothetical protein
MGCLCPSMRRHRPLSHSCALERDPVAAAYRRFTTCAPQHHRPDLKRRLLGVVHQMQKELDKAVRSAKNAISTAKKQYIVYALRDTVKLFRKQRTASAEREFVKKQLAQIRDLSRQEDRYFRRRNVAKLVFFYLNGYGVEFGIMECVKLCASPKFKDKRIGYMALQVLLDEQSEVLLLVVNVLKQDLQSDNHQIVALALHVVANLASAEIGQDLAPDVERLLHSRNPFIRKKAALAALRLCRRTPVLADSFRAAALELLKMPHHHGVLISGLALLEELLTVAPGALYGMLANEYQALLVQQLRETATAGFNPEYGFQGVCDPFLQCSILKMLRRLGQHDSAATEELHRTLIDVARSSERSHGVVLECVRTILALESSPSRNLAFAIQILGDFLRSRDPNLRLVGLELLPQAAERSMASVAAHQETIFECLRDADPTIQRRALSLLFAIGTAASLQRFCKELVSYLQSVREALHRYEILQRLWLLLEETEPDVYRRLDLFVEVAQKLPTGDDDIDDDAFRGGAGDPGSGASGDQRHRIYEPGVSGGSDVAGDAYAGPGLSVVQEIEAELADEVVTAMLANPEAGMAIFYRLMDIVLEQIARRRSAVTLLMHIGLAFAAEHDIPHSARPRTYAKDADASAQIGQASKRERGTSKAPRATNAAIEQAPDFELGTSKAPTATSAAVLSERAGEDSEAAENGVSSVNSADIPSAAEDSLNWKLAELVLHLPGDRDLSLRQRQRPAYLHRTSTLGRLAVDVLFRTALRTRLKTSAVFGACARLLSEQSKALSLDVQQRAREYLVVLENAPSETFEQLESAFSLPDSSSLLAWRRQGAARSRIVSMRFLGSQHRSRMNAGAAQLISFDDEEESAETSGSRAPDEQPAVQAPRQRTLLADAVPVAVSSESTNENDSRAAWHLDILESVLDQVNSSEEASAGSASASRVIYDDEKLRIQIQRTSSETVDGQQRQVYHLEAQFMNKSPRTFTEFLFQISVPNYILLEMMPATSGSLPPSTQPQRVTQRFRLHKDGHDTRPLTFRFRFTYVDPSGQRIVRQGLVGDVLDALDS